MAEPKEPKDFEGLSEVEKAKALHTPVKVAKGESSGAPGAPVKGERPVDFVPESPKIGRAHV